MTLDQLNDLLAPADHFVKLVSVQQTNSDSKAMYRWIDETSVPLFDRGSITSLIAAAKEELGTRFIRQHGLDTEVPADPLHTPVLTWTIPR